jgi:hypothetical protein
MNDYTKQELIQEYEGLKLILDFHIKNRVRIAMPDDEFEEYVNAALDRLNEIKDILNEHGQ